MLLLVAFILIGISCGIQDIVLSTEEKFGTKMSRLQACIELQSTVYTILAGSFVFIHSCIVVRSDLSIKKEKRVL